MHIERNKIYITFYDGKYIDKKRLMTAIEINPNVVINHESATTKVSVNNPIQLVEFDSMSEMPSKFCDSIIEFDFNYKESKNGSDK